MFFSSDSVFLMGIRVRVKGVEGLMLCMGRFPIECPKCGTEYDSRDEMKKVDKGNMEYTYHCTECDVSVLGVTIKNGEILDSTVF